MDGICKSFYQGHWNGFLEAPYQTKANFGQTADRWIYDNHIYSCLNVAFYAWNALNLEETKDQTIMY